VILDASAVIAILRDEPDAPRFHAAIANAEHRRISAATHFEAAAVIDVQRDSIASRKLDDLMQRIRVEIIPFTAAQAKLARDAYRDYGKGSGHPARLNFGDCFAYALAKELGEPVLFKGDDFSKTDVDAA
jgi:ribonuclease VapC